MAQTGYTPILIYASGTTTNTPLAANLTSSASGAELALNYADGKLFYKDSGGTVQVLATKGTGAIGGSNTQVQYNSSGSLAGSANLTFDGTTLTPNALTVTNAVTLSAGTANGVAYLNASNVLTTGSALTFDGTKLGVGVASAQAGVDVSNSGSWTSGSVYNYPAGNAFVKAQGVSAQNNWIGIAGSYGATTGSANLLLQANFNNTTQQAGHYIGSEAQSATSSDLTFGSLTGGSTTGTNATKNEQMRLTSTGLGIGTSSPAYKLDVSGTARISNGGDTYVGFGANKDNYWTTGTTSGKQVWRNSAGSEFMQLDSSGNLGLGVTPSAWASNYRVLQMRESYAALASDNGNGVAELTSNAYNDGSWRYANSSVGAVRYQANAVNRTHAWFNAPSGTAGNAISFTQAMTLDASGNLGVGTSSPTALSGFTSVTVNANGGGNAILDLQKSGSLQARLTGATNSLDVTADVITFTTGSISGGTLAERARIDSSGNLRVNNSASLPAAHTTGNINCSNDISTGSFLIGVNNSFLGRQSSDGSTILNTGQANLIFSRGTYGSTSESARIDSSGNLLLGLSAQTNTPANGVVAQNLTGASQFLIGHSNGSGSGTYYEAYFYNSTNIGSITQNGTTGVLFNITSDYRLKDVVGAVTGSGERIDALNPVDYTWKADGSFARGFLAHQFQDVYPGSVTGTKDAVDEDGNPVYQQMQASTTEVIADLVAELQSLRRRVAQLEGK